MATDTATVSQYNGGDLLTNVIIFQVLTWFSVVLRIYVRTMLTRKFQVDDWLMLLAQINFTLSCAFIAAGLTVGLGHHNAVLPQWEEILAIKWQALATATYISNMMFIKLSIGVFLLRLATQRSYRWILLGSMSIVASMSTALFLWDVFQCKPVAAQWDYTIPNYTCASTLQIVEVAYVLSVLNILTDWLYALLPIPMLWNAKITPQAKATVSIVLSLGIFASVATLIRVKFLVDLTDANDILYAGTDPMVWTLVEPGVAIVASSLVTIRPLLRQLRLNGFESTERNRGFWAIYGRNDGGGASRLEEDKPGSKKSRASRGMAGLNQDTFKQADIKLSDLEGGHGVSDGKITAQNSKGPSNREISLLSLLSQSSTHDEGLVRESVVRNFSTPLKSIAVRDKVKQVDGEADGNDADEGDRSPVSPWPLVGTGTECPESVFVIRGSGQDSTLRGHLHNGKIMRRSERLNSPEEAEAIQGLRDEVSRTTQGRPPLT